LLKAGVAVVGAAGFTTIIDPIGPAAAQVRVFPPPPPPVSPIAGLIDTHVHSAPDVFGRSMDDDEIAALYKERGMEAIVFKNHVVSTADRAWFARKHVAGIKAFGGLVLNSAVGGINPDAVNWMWRMQGGYGRVIWFPTFDADNHVKHFKDAPEAIKVLGADGKVLPEVRAVLKIAAEQKLVVETGHLSPSEALAVIEAGRDMGVDRLVVTHAQFEVVNMSVEEMKRAAAMGAKLELCAMGPLMGPAAHFAWMRHWRQVKVQETAAAVKEVGAQHFVLATDLGQTGNPTPADGLQMFVTDLMKEGVSKEDIQMMGREVTGKLLMG
jgi:microsomal dipeptidase-like Zn-dependent dipeptidase